MMRKRRKTMEHFEQRNRPKFSVVIPLYNKQAYIQETLRSVLSQTYTNYEIIVVDDGSLDASLEQTKSVQDSRLTILEQRNQGVAVARNTGIYAAKGEYIAFLDADDGWDDNYLETICHLIDAYPESDLFVTAYRVLLGNHRTHISKQRTPENGCLGSYWLTLGGGYDFVWTSATTVRKSALLAAGCFKPGERLGQDLDMWARVARINPKVAYSSKVCVSYNRGADQNARTRIKIAYPAAFLQDLTEELENPQRSSDELAAIGQKYDLKMTAYIFTAILAGEKDLAKQELKRWNSTQNGKFRFVKFGLRCAAWMPHWVNRLIYQIRLRVF